MEEEEEKEDGEKTKQSDSATTPSPLVPPRSRPSTSSASSSSTASTASPTISVPKVAPRTSYEFELQWRSFRGSTELGAAYLQVIDPKNVPKLFKHLEGPVFMGILTAISEHWGDRVEDAFQWLSALRHIDRFDVNVMFLSHSEKEVIRNILSWRPGSEEAHSLAQAFTV